MTVLITVMAKSPGDQILLMVPSFHSTLHVHVKKYGRKDRENLVSIIT